MLGIMTPTWAKAMWDAGDCSKEENWTWLNKKAGCIPTHACKWVLYFCMEEHSVTWIHTCSLWSDATVFYWCSCKIWAVARFVRRKHTSKKQASSSKREHLQRFLCVDLKLVKKRKEIALSLCTRERVRKALRVRLIWESQNPPVKWGFYSISIKGALP